MPSSVTHSYFASDVYNKFKNKNKINLNYLKVFGQGPDPYFFYDFHLSRKAKEVHKINTSMQHSLVNKHFVTLINYINKMNYNDNVMVMSYLYGQICHFALDSTIHPFTIYMSGRYDEKDKNTYKYNGMHEKMEYYTDIYLIYQRENIMPKKYKVYNEIFKFDEFNDELKDTIDKVVKEVYSYDNVSTIYYKCLKDMKKFYHVFNYDRFGVKKSVYSIMDAVCGDKIVKKKELSFHVNPNSHLEYLNLDNNTWRHPCTGEEFNYSFFDLYDMALVKAVKIINEIVKMLNDKKIDNKRIEKLFGNLDYGTGMDCDLEMEYKYFKY